MIPSAARKLMEIVKSVEPVQDNRIYIELTGRSCRSIEAGPAAYKASRFGDHTPLALETGKRHLSEIHRQRCGPICVSSATGLQYSQHIVTRRLGDREGLEW